MTVCDSEPSGGAFVLVMVGIVVHAVWTVCAVDEELACATVYYHICHSGDSLGG